MKMQTNIWTALILVIGFTSIIGSGCNQDDDPIIKEGVVTDEDGNEYVTVIVGGQTWMAENLRSTVYNNGTAIPEVTENEVWATLTTGGYCWYDNNNLNKDPYGALYNWHAVNTGMLAPNGWHVATKEDWEQLIDYLGGALVAGPKIKELGIAHWADPNENATNETGFTAVGNGYRNDSDGPFDIMHDGRFIDLLYRANWWTSTQDPDYSDAAWAVDMLYNSNSIGMNDSPKGSGRAVRCVKNQE